MIPEIDFDGLVSNVLAAMRGILDEDARLLRGYSEAKLKTIARFTKLVGEGYAQGFIDLAEFEEHLERLDDMIERFIRNLRALAAVTIEKLISAVTGTVYGAIGGAARAAGVPLPPIGLPGV
jgi:hypothetical protein